MLNDNIVRLVGCLIKQNACSSCIKYIIKGEARKIPVIAEVLLLETNSRLLPLKLFGQTYLFDITQNYKEQIVRVHNAEATEKANILEGNFKIYKQNNFLAEDQHKKILMFCLMYYQTQNTNLL